MEDCPIRGKLLKNLRLLMEITQEQMAGEFGMSSSRLRDIEQEKVPLSARLQTRVMKRLPILIITRLADSLSLDNDPTNIGLPYWEKVLHSVRSLSPDSIDESQLPEIARQFYLFVPYRSRGSVKDIEAVCSDEKSRKWFEKYKEPLEAMESKYSSEINDEEFQCPSRDADHESIFTAKIDRNLLERLENEAGNRGLSLSKLLESIANYYFESKRLFTNEGKSSEDPV
jgi:transcriptional regulator with XRE-family HTH domain